MVALILHSSLYNSHIQPFVLQGSRYQSCIPFLNNNAVLMFEGIHKCEEVMSICGIIYEIYPANKSHSL